MIDLEAVAFEMQSVLRNLFLLGLKYRMDEETKIFMLRRTQLKFRSDDNAARLMPDNVRQLKLRHLLSKNI